MRYVFAVVGSRGDVQPAVALGTELAARGHDVTMAVPPNLVDFSAGVGLRTEAYGVDTKELIGSDLIQHDLKSRNPRRRLKAVAEVTYLGGRDMQQRLIGLAEGADAIIATAAGQDRAHAVARYLDIPHLPVHYCPIRSNRTVSVFDMLGWSVPPAIGEFSWWVLERLLALTIGSTERTLLADIGLSPGRGPLSKQISATGVPEIQAYDPAIVPGLVDDWGDRRPLVGFLNLTAAQRSKVGDAGVDAELDAWLDAGEPPLYVGFGSMHIKQPEALAAAIMEAATALDLRVLVAQGWNDFMADVDDPRVRVVGAIDHDAVLPRCCAVMHHGGAGSVAAGLRAGAPTIVAWLSADQPLWGTILRRANLGASQRMSKVTGPWLTEALREALSPKTIEAAQSVRDQLVAPADAARAAAEVIERSSARSLRQSV